ncbi:MAG TPA: hypothetical protein VJT73_17915 [Polyangiaceae bacterium]|nr:hypothetical protein [Polyangiaceae bacterium]
MTDSLQNARKRGAHERTIRTVVDFANEVRIHLQNAQVIFGSVANVPKSENGSFCIRPWGLTSSMAIQFDDVSLAAPVKQMGWEKHRAIAAAQQAGIFSASTGVPPRQPVANANANAQKI